MGHANYDNMDNGSVWQALASIFLTIIGMVTLNDAVLIVALIASCSTVILNVKKIFTKNGNKNN